MAAVAITNTFTNNTVADGSQVNTNFSDLVTYINNRNDGSVTWDRCLVTSSSAVPLIVNNSTGTSNIVNFQDNGTNVLSIVDGGATRFADGTVALPSISFLSDTNTGIYWVSADSMAISVGGVRTLSVDGSGVTISNGWLDIGAGQATSPGIRFAGDTNTGLYWISADRIAIATGGVLRFDIDSVGSAVFSGSVYLGTGTAASPILSFAGDVNTGLYWISADKFAITNGGAKTFEFGTTNFDPVGAGAISSGDATNYWNDVSYKTLTDRGCLGCFDKGVELQDGRIVSDTEALLEIKTHPTKKTIYGVDMFDYRTFPKVAYKKADKAGVLLSRDINDEPIGGADGVEMTSMFAIMIGAIKELTNRIKVLEAKNG